MKNGSIPSAWKKAEVKPIFKKGDKSSPGNYRPVSLTSIVCKIFEGFVREALNNHFMENDLLSKDQFGFTKARSCVSQLLVTINDWINSIDNDEPVDCIYLDLRKAFDTVSHKLLIYKLRNYGISGNLLKWITSFLSDRTQFVNVNGACSGPNKVTSGVPQGSVLGPTLFIYYINDLPLDIDCKVKIFADDTKAYSTVDISDESRLQLQRNIDTLVKWSDTWMMKFNSQKCKVLHIGKDNPRHKYYMNDEGKVNELDITIAEKDLGIIIDPNLSFETHINEVVKKCNRLTGMLIRTMTNLTPKIMIPLFKSLVRPVLEYGNSVWNPFLRRHIDLLEGVQRSFTKRLVKVQKLSYEQRLRKLKLPSLEFRRFRGDLIEVYKITHNLYDSQTINHLLPLFDDDRTRGHKFKLKKFACKTRIAQNFFSNRIINVWNNLDEEVVKTESLNTFKNDIDNLFYEYMYATNFGDKI